MPTAAERAADWTAPPTSIGYPNPPGPIVYALVQRDGETVGAVWATRNGQAPKAGIIVSPGPDPDYEFQTELGAVALAFRAETTPAEEWLNHLAETRTGQGGTLSVARLSTLPTLPDVYASLGHDI